MSLSRSSQCQVLVWYSLLSHQLNSGLTHEERLCQLEPACRALSPDDLEHHLSAVDANIHHLAVFSGVALFSPAALFSAKWRRHHLRQCVQHHKFNQKRLLESLYDYFYNTKRKTHTKCDGYKFGK